MSKLIIFIHGIGSDNKVWKNFIKRHNEDSLTKNTIKYTPNKTEVLEENKYYFLYEYKSKKFSSFPGNKLFQNKILGIENPGDISINAHSDTFLYKVEEFAYSFDNINIVAHSMGGIIAMITILKIIENNEIKDKIKTCIFYGSPLKGSDDPTYLESIFNNKVSSNVLKELKPTSSTIINLLKDIKKNKLSLKGEFDINFIKGDADTRIIDIGRDFIDSFGTFKQIDGGHSEIVNPKDIHSSSFISYKNIMNGNEKKVEEKGIEKDGDEELGNTLLLNYITKKSNEFNSESNSLKTLKNNIFLNIFDITSNGHNIESENNLSYLSTLCTEQVPKFLLSNYGMGKSTISKQLFNYINEETDNDAIFINLHLKNLKHFYRENDENAFYQKVLTSKIFEEIIKYNKDDENIDFQKKELFDYYFSLLEKGKLILIFDGLDEVNISSNDVNDKLFLKNAELDDFINTIFDSNYSIFVTCRKEYTPFYNIFNFHKNTKKTYEIELLEWCDVQWNKYIDFLEKDVQKDLSSFRHDILNNKYADLPKRPLFLSMLTELIIYGNNDISNINPSLETNLAEIYNKYIDFCLNNDVNTKSQEVKYRITNNEEYKIVWKKLLIHLAYLEYKSNKKVTLNKIVLIAKSLDGNEKYYEREMIEATLESSALFSIIHREQSSKDFSFSHKSFLEYLVGFKLAEDIFSSTIEDSSCNNVWKLYQTIEIHHHFMAEIVRVAFYKGLIKPSGINELSYTQLYGNKYIEIAFGKILDNYTNIKKEKPDILLTLHEDYQAIIYYIGKFKIHSLKRYLDDIVKNEEEYHSILYRTVSLSLSSINEDMSYCDTYILRIIDNLLDGDGLSFYNNQNIQKKYHGSDPEKLRKRLEKNLNIFLETDAIISNISLIILTYYTTFTVSDQMVITFSEELKEIKKIAEKKSNHELVVICDKIPKIWLKMMESHIKLYN